MLSHLMLAHLETVWICSNQFLKKFTQIVIFLESTVQNFLLDCNFLAPFFTLKNKMFGHTILGGNFVVCLNQLNPDLMIIVVRG